MTPYNDSFYSDIAPKSRASADVIVPLVLKLIPAQSVIDVGCGDGTWLAAFAANGVTDFQGFDGPYVDPACLQVPVERFTPVNLNRPFSISRQFDLALSLEVAEHLEPHIAASHVEGLTRLAPVVLFSAAAPGQDGTNHINEQWPEYWAELFAARNYRAVDAIRPQLSRFSNGVGFWYAQNSVLYVKESSLEEYPLLAPWAASTRMGSLAWIHPEHYEAIRMQLTAAQHEAEHWAVEANSLRRTLARLPGLIRRAARKR